MTKQFAQIIVDVPTMQTNQPYTYIVPQNMVDSLMLGMRVTVPFGARQVMGFVVGLISQTELSEEQLRPITKILDLTPVINTELLSLSSYLAEETFAFRITILQTMLPSAFKANYERTIKIIDEVDEDVRERIFKGLDEIPFKSSDFNDTDIAMLLKLRRQHKIEVTIEVHNKVKIKTQLAYQFSNDIAFLEEELEGLNKSAKKQKIVLQFILGHLGETWAKKELQEVLGLSNEIFNQAAIKKWLKKTQVELLRDPFRSEVQPTELLKLNQQQQEAYEQVVGASDTHKFQPFLLEGITGSGKTEVYLQAAQHVFEQEKTVLFLVPEIALTPQMVRRVKGRFGAQTAVLHSGLSDGERYDEWRRIERGDVKIVVGARSAVFAPLDNIGLIIVDEEHETTYKQSDNPRYDARKIALWRGDYYQIPVVLGSATPSLESRARAQKGIYELLTLTERAGDAKLPSVQIIDMKETLAQGPETNFSNELRIQLIDRLEKGEQTVLMLNRRGFSSFVMCRDCGYVPCDPNCNLAMTLHMDTHTLKCHYCGHEESIPTVCAQCGSNRIRYYGTGTEKVEAELHELLPKARVIRMDQDTTRKRVVWTVCYKNSVTMKQIFYWGHR
ncbi:hypothetical protein GCM10025879_16730 [Leuconostoc litchii]|nr:hypothetical protein GCM10025879_16730 [Leuconostoc litchii]